MVMGMTHGLTGELPGVDPRTCSAKSKFLLELPMQVVCKVQHCALFVGGQGEEVGLVTTGDHQSVARADRIGI
jgi:hypothetical protein